MYIDITKERYDNLIANIMLSGEKVKAFAVRSRTRKECTLTTSVQYGPGSPN
jgi:hypothetical protein